MSDTPCTCGAHRDPGPSIRVDQAAFDAAVDEIRARLVASATPPAVADLGLDPATLERVVEAFTAAAADSADARMQTLEGRVAEMESVLATVLAEWAASTMQAV